MTISVKPVSKKEITIQYGKDLDPLAEIIPATDIAVRAWISETYGISYEVSPEILVHRDFEILKVCEHEDLLDLVERAINTHNSGVDSWNESYRGSNVMWNSP